MGSHIQNVSCAAQAGCTPSVLGQALAPAKTGGPFAAAVGWCAVRRFTTRIGGQAGACAPVEHMLPAGQTGSMQAVQSVVWTSARMGAYSWAGCMCIAAHAVQVCNSCFIESSAQCMWPPP